MKEIDRPEFITRALVHRLVVRDNRKWINPRSRNDDICTVERGTHNRHLFGSLANQRTKATERVVVAVQIRALLAPPPAKANQGNSQQSIF